METKKQIACPVCTSSETREMYMKAQFHVRSCNTCSLVFIDNPPQDTGTIYDHSYFWGGSLNGGYVNYEEEKRAMRNVFEDYIKRISSYTHTGRLLDVGAATGFFLRVARDAGWDVSGVEISKEATAEAVRNGINMHTGRLETASFNDASFNCITMFDLIEHVTNPHTLIKKARDLLSTEGLLVINTPNIGSLYARILGKGWHLLCPPEHLTLFSKKSITTLLSQHGFEILWFGNIGKTFTIQYIIHQLGHWIPALRSIFKYIPIEKTWLGKISIPLNFHDNMFLIARKK